MTDLPSHYIRRPRKLLEIQIVELQLTALIQGLCREHPTLEDFAEHGEPLALSQARNMLDAIDLLRFALDTYDNATCRRARASRQRTDDETF